MFSCLIMTILLAQVPAGAPGAGEAARATQSQPSERRKAELQRLVELRKERRARAAAAWQQERDEARKTAERLAPVITAQQQAEAARLHLQARQAHQSPVLYPFVIPPYPYSWPRPWGPIILGPLPEPIPLGPFPEPLPGPAPLSPAAP
jgi:hypothetical protein